MISVIVTTVGYYNEYVAPLIVSLEKYGSPEILVTDQKYIETSRAYELNQGMSVASGDWFLILDDDVICEGEYDFLEELDPDKIYGAEMIRPYLNGWFLFFHRSLYEKIGGFDENFAPPMTFGDYDYCRRAEEAGYKSKEIEVPFTHLYAATKLEINPKRYEDGVL